MRMPPWAIEAIRNGVADVARKASDAETIAKVKEQATELLRDLPENASRGIDAIIKTASEKARGAYEHGRDSVLRWNGRQVEFSVRTLNVRGVLFNDEGTGIAVSDDVLQLGCDLLRGDCLDDDLGAKIEQSLTKLLDVDGNDLVVANNLDAAVASLGALASERTLVLHRSQAIRLPSGVPLPDAFAGAALTECGGVQAIDPGDFDSVALPACVLLADDGQKAVEPLDFSGRDVVTVAIVPYATLTETLESVPCVRELLRSGVDLVVSQGGPLSGSNASGLIAGKRSLVEKIRRSQSWQSYQANTAAAAMAMAAIQSSEPYALSILIETSEENLRSRAERLATRLTADPEIAACQITDQPAELVSGARWQFPSRQLRLRHRSLSANAWAKQLGSAEPALMVSTAEDDVVVDLRWLQARDDALVADLLSSQSARDPDASSDPAASSDPGSSSVESSTTVESD